MKTYDRNEIEEIVEAAVARLVRNDLLLLQQDVNERSVSHKLAEYLQLALPEWHVDCEYNRDHDLTKQLRYSSSCEPANSLKARTVYPDIVVHRRNTNHNLLVIEMKKEANIVDDDKAKDENKLRAFVGEPFRYQHGLFIAFGTDGTYTWKWFPEAECSHAT